MDAEEMCDKFKQLYLNEKSAISLEKFEPEYVLHLDAQRSDLCGGSARLAATSSNHEVRLYSRNNLAVVGVIKGHEKVLTGVRFAHHDTNLLFTSSQDGTIKSWDLRTDMKAAANVFEGYPETKNVFTAFDLGSNDRVVCAGTEANKDGDCHIIFWDNRNGQPLGVYSESHQDDVTQIHFHPTSPDKMATGSTDGLVNVFDISQTSEDDALLTSLNTESSVAQVGWCGPGMDQVYCITHIETLHVWDTSTEEFETITDMRDVRGTYKGPTVDYMVDCFQLEDNDSPFLLLGDKSGTCHVASIEGDTLRHRGSMRDGHSDIIRCLTWDKQTETLVTGGEDAMLCLWSPQPATKTTMTATARDKPKMKVKGQSWSKKLNQRELGCWNRVMWNLATNARGKVYKSFLEYCLLHEIYLKSCVNTTPVPGFFQDDKILQQAIFVSRIDHAKQEMKLMIESLQRSIGLSSDIAASEFAVVKVALEEPEIAVCREVLEETNSKILQFTELNLKKEHHQLTVQKPPIDSVVTYTLLPPEKEEIHRSINKEPSSQRQDPHQAKRCPESTGNNKKRLLSVEQGESAQPKAKKQRWMGTGQASKKDESILPKQKAITQKKANKNRFVTGHASEERQINPIKTKQSCKRKQIKRSGNHTGFQEKQTNSIQTRQSPKRKQIKKSGNHTGLQEIQTNSIKTRESPKRKQRKRRKRSGYQIGIQERVKAVTQKKANKKGVLTGQTSKKDKVPPKKQKAVTKKKANKKK